MGRRYHGPQRVQAAALPSWCPRARRVKASGMRVEAFPWSDVPSALGIEGRLARARRAAERRFDLAALGPLLSRLFALELSGYGVSGVRVERALVRDAWSVALAYPELTLVLRCQPELVALLLTRLLERPLRLTDPRATVTPAIAGAWHAVAHELSRALCRDEPPQLDVGSNDALHGPATLLRGWVRLDARTYSVELAVLPGTTEQTESD